MEVLGSDDADIRKAAFSWLDDHLMTSWLIFHNFV